MQEKFTKANMKLISQAKFEVNKDSKEDAAMLQKRRQASCELVTNLQKLFVSMLYTNQSYVDPKSVLSSVVDDSGKLVKFGQEKDSTEYLLNLIERIEEGLGEQPPQENVRVAESMVNQSVEPTKKNLDENRNDAVVRKVEKSDSVPKKKKELFFDDDNESDYEPDIQGLG